MNHFIDNFKSKSLKSVINILNVMYDYYIDI